MGSDKNTDYKNLTAEVIKKQMIILGPNITLVKARNVKGLKIDDNGVVTEMSGPPQELIQELISQFVQLSGLIVQKTLEPLLANYPKPDSQAILKNINNQIKNKQGESQDGNR